MSELDEIQKFVDRFSWRPIDTAPADGRDILVYIGNPPMGDMAVVFYDVPPLDAPTHCWHRMDGLALHRNAPTFWMPLPDPPYTVEDKPSAD